MSSVNTVRACIQYPAAVSLKVSVNFTEVQIMVLNQSKGEGLHDYRYMSFSLGNEEFAFPLLSVKEVIGIPPITSPPNTSPYFWGL